MKLFGNKQGGGAVAAAKPVAGSATAVAEKPVLPKAPASEKKEPSSGGKAGRIALIAAAAVAAAIAAGAAAGVNYVNHVDTIFPNVTVDGLDIGGLTLTETAEKLSRNGYDDLDGKSVSVELPLDHTLTIEARDVCSETPVSDIALMAWDACKSGSAIGDTMTYLRCRFGGMELESGSALSVDQKAVEAAVESAAGEVHQALLDTDLSIGENSISILKGAESVEIDTDEVTSMIVKAFQDENYTTLNYSAEPQTQETVDLQSVYDTVFRESSDAAYNSATGEITPETVGISFDIDEAQRLWNQASYGEQVEIPLIVTEPEVTAQELQSMLFRDRLSSKSTSLAGSSGNRINNVRRAAESINGKVLSPGEEFSYNPALGERTKENGYLMAGAYSGGKTVQEYGGGICQVSSTLYYCTLYANLEITARTCHMFPVNYLPPGLDATVSWGGPEFKFVNNRDYPIRIDAAVDEGGKNVTVEIWGTDVDGSYVEVTYDTWAMYDPTYTSVQTGYKAQTYRSVFDKDGTLISRTSEASSTYNYHKENIAYPVETAQPQEETPIVIEDPGAGTLVAPETVAPAPTETQSEAPAETQPEAPSETQQEAPASQEAPVQETQPETPAAEPQPEAQAPVAEPQPEAQTPVVEPQPEAQTPVVEPQPEISVVQPAADPYVPEAPVVEFAPAPETAVFDPGTAYDPGIYSGGLY